MILILVFTTHLLISQCTGTWTPAVIITYQCASGPKAASALGLNVCPVLPQKTYTFDSAPEKVEIRFSGFGEAGTTGTSRLTIFLNGVKAGLDSACQIIIGCQPVPGSHSIDNGCLVNAFPGGDWGLSGYLFLDGSVFGWDSIHSVGVSVNEPTATTGAVFQIGSCDASICLPTDIDERNKMPKCNMYPNPSVNKMAIEFPKKGNYTLTFLNSLGALIKEMTVQNVDNLSVDKNDLGAGLFFLYIQEENGFSFRTKIVFL